MWSYWKTYFSVAWALKTPFVLLLDRRYKLVSADTARNICESLGVRYEEGFYNYIESPLDVNLAWSYGLFFADGSCGFRKEGNKSGGGWWTIVSPQKELIRAKKALEKRYPLMCFKVELFKSYSKGSKTNLGVRQQNTYSLVATVKQRHNDDTRTKFVAEFREMFYDKASNKRVPRIVQTAPIISKQVFIDGDIVGDGTKYGKNFFEVYCGSTVEATSLAQLIENAEYRLVNLKKDDYSEAWIVTFNKENNRTKRFRYIPDYSDCDDAAWLFKAESIRRGLNGAGFVIGRMNGKSHCWNVILSEYRVRQVEPQNGTVFKQLKDYRPWMVIL